MDGKLGNEPEPADQGLPTRHPGHQLASRKARHPITHSLVEEKAGGWGVEVLRSQTKGGS